MLSILGFIVVIVAAFFAFRTAKEYGRSAAAWTIGVLCVGYGIQFVIPILIGIVIGVVMLLSGNSEAEIQAAILVPAIIINVVCTFASIAAIMLMLRYLSTVPEETAFEPPPAPPGF